MKSKKFIVFIACYSLTSILLLFALIYANKPSTVVIRAFDNLVDNIDEREEFEFLFDTLTKGSIDFSLTQASAEGVDYLDSYFKGKLYFNEDYFAISNLDMQIDGNHIQGNLYVDNKDQTLYINENYILEDSYKISLDTAASELDNSIFSPYRQTKYSLPYEDYNEIRNMLLAAKDNDKMQKDLNKLTKKLFRKIWQIADESFEFETEYKSEDLNSKSKLVRLVTIKIDDDGLQSFIRDVYKYLRKNELIIDFLEKYENNFKQYTNSSSIEDEYLDFMDSLKDPIDNFVKSIENNIETLKIKLSVGKLTPKLLKLEVIAGKYSIIELDLGKKGIKKTDEISLKCGEFSLNYEVKKSNRKTFDADIIIKNKYYGENSILNSETSKLSLKINKKAGSYKLEFDDKVGYNNYLLEDNNIILTGSYEKSKNILTMTVDSYQHKKLVDNYYNSYDYLTLDVKCRIVLNKKDSINEPSYSYKNLSQITVSDIDRWISNLEENGWLE